MGLLEKKMFLILIEELKRVRFLLLGMFFKGVFVVVFYMVFVGML